MVKIFSAVKLATIMLVTLIAIPLSAQGGDGSAGSPPQKPATNSNPELVRYKSTPQRELYLHIFAPDADAFPGPRPAIVFFHGGGWNKGTPHHLYSQARHLSEKGMVAISAEYRTRDADSTEPDLALADAKSAMRFVRTHAEDFKIDDTRIAAGGGSAGGHLAAALATIEGFNDPGDDLSVSTRPDALVLFNPVIDNGPGGYGHQRVAEYWEEFSPIHNIRAGHPPVVFMLGTEDHLVPVGIGERYCQLVRATGAECLLHLYEGQPHSFFNPGRSEEYYRRTVENMDDFLRSLGFISLD